MNLDWQDLASEWALHNQEVVSLHEKGQYERAATKKPPEWSRMPGRSEAKKSSLSSRP